MHASAPIAPLIQDTGFYISYNEETTNILKLCKINFKYNEGNFKSYFDPPLYEEDGGIPLDIVSTKDVVY